jgi:LytR cell envelope-related transcriptional attenuator/Helix-turn-helix domain
MPNRESPMQEARILEPVPNGDESPLARARVHRKLTVEEAAKRADLPEEQVQWLEEGRLYRFPTADHALLATLLYATALGIDHREAQEIAGLPVDPLPVRMNPVRRFGAMTAFAALVLAAVLAVAFARSESSKPSSNGAAATPANASALPAPWAIKVVVLNGSGDIVYTRTIASHIQAMGYKITHVGKATAFNYPQTQVYYPPGGEAIGVRLAKALDVPVQPLPGGSNPRRLVVIVGPERGPG